MKKETTPILSPQAVEPKGVFNCFMPKEIQDNEGTIWSCIQAYAGLSNSAEKQEAASVEGAPHLVEVVCTPSGGAQTIRLELPADWENKLSDEDLLGEIEKQSSK